MSNGSAEGCRDAFGYLLEGEIEYLQELARQLRPGALIVNIGAGAGTSCLAFLEARDDLRVTTVDIQREGSPLGSLEGELNALRDAGLLGTPRHSQIHGDSASVGRAWDGGPVGLVFIDGDHSYAGCRADIEAWGPHVEPEGFVVLHDYHSETWPEVVRAAADTLDSSPAILPRRQVVTVRAYQVIP